MLESDYANAVDAEKVRSAINSIATSGMYLDEQLKDIKIEVLKLLYEADRLLSNQISIEKPGLRITTSNLIGDLDD